MKQLYTLVATLAAVAGVIAALHPTFIPEGGIVQSLTPYLAGLVTGVFGMAAFE